jgi:molybdenum cofactor biosynthesis enzyme MoaA
MRLEEIGFYTLSDERAAKASGTSPMYRCEMILTSRCNFNCPYCRGLRMMKGDIDFEVAKTALQLWIKDGLKNVRFSGGEPTMYPYLNRLVRMCKEGGVEHIAISTNGSAHPAISGISTGWC